MSTLMPYRTPDLLSEVRALREQADVLEFELLLARLMCKPIWVRVWRALVRA